MNVKQFKLLALFVTIVAATQTIASGIQDITNSIPDLNSPQKIDAQAQSASSQLNDFSQTLNTDLINMGQSVSKFGYGPLRIFATDAGESVEAKLDPFVAALEAGYSKGSAVVSGVDSAMTQKAAMFTTVAKSGFSTFVSEAQSALASTPVGQNAFVEQATQAVGSQLGLTQIAQTSSDSGSGEAPSPALQKAAKKYVTKMRSSPQFSDAGATSDGISYLLTTVLFELSAVDQSNPLSALPVHRRDDSSSGSSGFLGALGGLSQEAGPLSGLGEEAEAEFQNQHIVGLQNVVPNVQGTRRDLVPDFPDFFNGDESSGSDASISDFPNLSNDDGSSGSDASVSDSGETTVANDNNVGTSSPAGGSTQIDDQTVDAKGPGGEASAPTADVPIIVSDGSQGVTIPNRRMHYRRRQLLN